MIFEQLKDLIKNELGFATEDLTLESTLEDMGADSLDAVELIMAIEEEFGIEISESDAQQFTTLGSIANYVETKKN